MRANDSSTSRFALKRARLVALAILALALFLRVWHLTGRSLWLDEAVEYWTATSPVAHLPSYVRDIIQDPPLYSFLLHVWMRPASDLAWMRLLSVLFGLGSVAGAMVLGYRMQGRAAALGAGLLMAVMPTSVYYSQELGQYAPMQCLIIWSMVALLALAREPSRRAYVRWGVLAVASMYMYYGTPLPVLIPFLCFVVDGFRQRDRARIRAGLVTLAAVFVAILPLLVYFIPSQLHRGPTERAFEVGALSAVTGSFLTALKVTFAFWFTGWPSTAVPGWITVALVFVLLVFAARSQRRFALWLGITVVVYVGIGWLNIFPFGFRHSLILAPLFVPLVACGFGGLRSRWLRMAATAVFAALCLAAILSPVDRQLRQHLFGVSEGRWPETEDIGPITKNWAEHRSPGQPTYVYYAAAPAFAYYAERYAHENPTRPPDWFLHCWRNRDDAPWCREGGIYYGRWLRGMKSGDKAESIFQSMNQVPDEFWYIMGHSQKKEQDVIGRLLNQHFDFTDAYSGEDAAAVLVRRAKR